VLKETSTTPARICVMYYDAANTKLSNKDILYTPVGSSWEAITTNTFTTPANTSYIRIFLLTNGGTGTQGFDNISLKEVSTTGATNPVDTAPVPAPAPAPNIPQPPTAVKAVTAGTGNQVQLSWGPSASTDVVNYKVYRSQATQNLGNLVGDNIQSTTLQDNVTEGQTYY